MKTKNMLDNDVIALNFKAFEAMLAKSTDVFNTPSNKEHSYLFDRKGCEDGSDCSIRSAVISSACLLE